MTTLLNPPSSERLTPRQVSRMYNVSPTTLGRWRKRRDSDVRFPRYHRMITGRVYYVRGELAACLAGMEVVA